MEDRDTSTSNSNFVAPAPKPSNVPVQAAYSSKQNQAHAIETLSISKTKPNNKPSQNSSIASAKVLETPAKNDGIGCTASSKFAQKETTPRHTDTNRASSSKVIDPVPQTPRPSSTFANPVEEEFEDPSPEVDSPAIPTKRLRRQAPAAPAKAANVTSWVNSNPSPSNSDVIEEDEDEEIQHRSVSMSPVPVPVPVPQASSSRVVVDNEKPGPSRGRSPSPRRRDTRSISRGNPSPTGVRRKGQKVVAPPSPISDDDSIEEDESEAEANSNDMLFGTPAHARARAVYASRNTFRPAGTRTGYASYFRTLILRPVLICNTKLILRW